MRSKHFALLAAAAVFTMGFGLYLFLHSKQAKRGGDVVLSGLHQEVRVNYDEWGVPHIYAQNEEDLYYALGYVHASDRLFQMEVMRRVGKGRIAEIFGTDAVKIDRFFRTLQIGTFAKEYVTKMDHSSMASIAIQSYYKGVNQFQQTGPLPVEFSMLNITPEPFSAEDAIATAAVMAYRFNKAFATDPVLTYIRDQLGKEFLFGLPTQVTQRGSASGASLPQDMQSVADLAQAAEKWLRPVASFEGSNAWAIAGSRTRSGKPMLANDPHIAYSAPSTWYEAHISCPGFELYGHHLAGIPFALLGHNTEIGWGLTMLQNKDFTFYVETVNPNNPNQVLYHKEWQDLKVTEETIKVKGEADIAITVRRSPRGLIINDVVDSLGQNNDLVAADWSFADFSNDTMSALYGMAHSHDIHDFESHLGQIHSPGLNVMYADRHDNIAWWAVGKLPIYPANYPVNMMVAQQDLEPSKLRYRPFSENPRSINPASGVLMSANNPVDGQDPAQGYFNIDARIRRIRELLANKTQGWTPEDMQTLQLDTMSPTTRDAAQKLFEVLEHNVDVHGHARAAAALNLMKNWDGSHLEDSQQALLYSEFEAHMIEQVFKPRLPEALYTSFLSTNFLHDIVPRLLNQLDRSPWLEKTDTQPLGAKDLIAQIWIKTVDGIVARHGTDMGTWRWDSVNHLRFTHALGRVTPLNHIFNIGPFPIAGGSEVINNQNGEIGVGPRTIIAGPSTRRIIDFSAPTKSHGINPTGQSGYFFDRHYDDQSAMFARGEYRAQLMDRSEIEENVRTKGSVLILRPLTDKKKKAG